MKNKKAWIRIAEASIAVLIVMSVVIILIANKKPADISKDIYERQKQIMNIIIENSTLRQDILDGDLNNLNQEISKMIPYNWEFEARICNIDDLCSSLNSPYSKEVFTTERIITSTLTTHPAQPKKLRFFVWMR